MTQGSVLPAIDGQACVHALAARASCDACVQACPHEALLLDEDGLKIDTARCNGCGHCLPACPRKAIGLAPPPVSHATIRVDATAALACRRVASGALPCQHALGLRDLAALTRDGVRTLFIHTGACSTCPDQPRSPGLAATVALHARLRASRGQAPLTVRAQAAPPPVPPAAVDRSRRRLFAALLGESARPAAADTPEPLAAVAPVIDALACTACDACVRICPEGALRRQGGEAPAYRLVPDHCSGCGLCVDLCGSGAIRLESPSPARESVVPLVIRQCRACGVPFPAPAAQSPPAEAENHTPLCPICRLRPPNRSLFQVLPS